MKPISTRKKVIFLQNYIKEWYSEWHKKHPENITGFRIGKKISNGKVTNRYSIIFQVAKKQSDSLKEEHIIPKLFEIVFPDGKTRIIKSDVEETGHFDFQLGVTNRVESSLSSKYGSAGLFVTDNSNRTFMITNYHVVANNLLRNGVFFYQRSSNMNSDVQIVSPFGRTLGRFEIGMFSREVDVAFVEIFSPPKASMNTLPDQNRIQGRIPIRPIPPYFINRPVKIYSLHNPMGRNALINSNSSMLYTGTSLDRYLEDLIQIKPRITSDGDSGGIVLTPSNAVLGIVVGADNNYTYVIPFYKINDFKNVSII